MPTPRSYRHASKDWRASRTYSQARVDVPTDTRSLDDVDALDWPIV